MYLSLNLYVKNLYYSLTMTPHSKRGILIREKKPLGTRFCTESKLFTGEGPSG